MAHVYYCDCCGVIPACQATGYCDGCLMDITAYLFVAYTQEGLMQALFDLSVDDERVNDNLTYGLQGN